MDSILSQTPGFHDGDLSEPGIGAATLFSLKPSLTLSFLILGSGNNAQKFDNCQTQLNDVTIGAALRLFSAQVIKDKLNEPKAIEQPLNSYSTGGVVLCGGKSTRMGASKAWLEFGDEVMLQRMTRILAPVVAPLVVVAAPEQKIPIINSDVIVVRDEYPELGPLSGIYSGLKALATRNVEFGFVTACDCPFLKPEFVRFLIKREDNEHDMVLLRDGKYSHVLSAIYRTSLHETAKQLLESGKLRPLGLTEHQPTLVLDVEEARSVDPELSSLVNLNSPDDYQAALDRLRNE